MSRLNQIQFAKNNQFNRNTQKNCEEVLVTRLFFQLGYGYLCFWVGYPNLA